LRQLEVAIVLAAMLVAPALAIGQGEPSKETIATARQHFQSGKKAHDAKSYDIAATEYLLAYEMYPQPLFIYNVAQVKRLAGDTAAAIAKLPAQKLSL